MWIINGIAILLPAFWSYKALKNGNEEQQMQLLAHWIVLAIFLLVTPVIDPILGWLPFYHLFKFVILYKITFKDLAQSLYNDRVRPFIAKREEGLENWSGRMQRLAQFMDVGTKWQTMMQGVWSAMHPCCHNYAQMQQQPCQQPCCTQEHVPCTQAPTAPPETETPMETPPWACPDCFAKYQQYLKEKDC